MRQTNQQSSDGRRGFYRFDGELPIRFRIVTVRSDESVVLSEEIETTCANLSGSGALFNISQPLAVGAYMFASLKLPESKSWVRTVVQVVRCKEIDDDDPPCWFVACKFVLIQESDQDSLVKFVLRQSLEEANESQDAHAVDVSH